MKEKRLPLMSGKRNVKTGLPLLRYDEDLCILFVQMWEAICFGDSPHDAWKNIKSNPNIDQILQNFDFDYDLETLTIIQKKLGSDEHYGGEGDYLMKVQFDKD